ncbi:MAG: hypothetical protein Q4A21_01810 [bacterium]|nr:hypothetical protein [bacterium]
MKKQAEFEALVRDQLGELYDYAYNTPETPANSTDLAVAQSYYEDLRAELYEEWHKNSRKVGRRSSKMRGRAQSIFRSAKESISKFGGRSIILSIEKAKDSLDGELMYLGGMRLDAVQAKIGRRDGARKKGLINRDRQNKFAKGAVNFIDREINRFERNYDRRSKEADRLSIRSKRVS